MNEEKLLQELEKNYLKTVKELNNMSLDQLRDLVREKRDILDSMDYALAIQKAHGSLSKVIDIDKKFGERWLEDFQDPFWDELRIKKARNGFLDRISEFQQDLKDTENIYDVENLLDSFYDDFKWIQDDWISKCFWDYLTDKDIFDKQTLIEFIDVLDEYKERLVSDEI